MRIVIKVNMNSKRPEINSLEIKLTKIEQLLLNPEQYIIEYSKELKSVSRLMKVADWKKLQKLNHVSFGNL